MSGSGGGAGLTVRGGARGTSAGLEDLDGAAERLRGCAGDAALLHGRVLLLASDPVAGASLLLSPETGAAVGLAAARVLGPGGLGSQCVELYGLGEGVALAVAGYRQTEAEVSRQLEALQDAVMGVVADALPLVLVAGAGAALGVEASGGDPLVELDRLAYRAPWAVDVVAGGLDGFVAELGDLDPAVAAFLGLGAGIAGRPYPPRDQEDAVASLAALAGLGGMLSDTVPVAPVLRSTTTGAPLAPTVSGLVADQAGLGDPDGPQLRVVELPQADGTSRWVVEVVGTMSWSPQPGRNASDLSSDIALMDGDPAALAAGIERALAQAQATSVHDRPTDAGGRPRDPAREGVTLGGHSQGGIAAAALASSPAFLTRHSVTHLVTTGAPISRFPVAPHVQVLSVEHAQDPVAHLDGGADPDTRTWTTVTQDLDETPMPDRRAAVAHSGELYRATVARAESLPEVRDYEVGLAPALSSVGAPVVREYDLVRSVPR